MTILPFDISAPTGTPAAAWAAYIAVVASLIAVTKQAFDLVRNRKKERVDIQIALEQQPLVREQLEVGNMRGAVETLNLIIAAQAAQLTRQEKRLSGCEVRESELEAEAEKWEGRYREQATISRQLAKAGAELRGEVRELRAEVARLRAGNGDPGPDSVL